MVYTLSELKRIVTPIADKYRISEVYLFGSYARGDATDSLMYRQQAYSGLGDG